VVSDTFRPVPVVRVGRTQRLSAEDKVATEEPLEVRLHGKPFAVIMRTPGADKDLAAGFLLSEGVLTSSADLGAVEHCRHPHHPEVHNIVDVFVVAAARATVDRHLSERRNVLANSSCGLCGRVTIESLQCRATRLLATWTVDPAVAATLPDVLRARQRVFDETGGLHAAGLFTREGECSAFAEDVGRHNAVDKVIGRMLIADELPLDDLLLVVSGRASFEIVQKAWIAGVGFICAVSAPSSLAIELAAEAGITLIGFARDGGFNIYTHRERLSEV
jgi:FdhD protein